MTYVGSVLCSAIPKYMKLILPVLLYGQDLVCCCKGRTRIERYLRTGCCREYLDLGGGKYLETGEYFVTSFVKIYAVSLDIIRIMK